MFVFRCCRLPYLWVSWFRFMFTLVRHSFASLIDKQLSTKATLMFQDVLLFELFQRTLPNPFLFSFKSTLKFSRQNLQVRKKAYCPRTAPGRAIHLFLDLSATNQRAPWSKNTTRTCNPYKNCTWTCSKITCDDMWTRVITCVMTCDYMCDDMWLHVILEHLHEGFL